jgi:hypothetical protein
MGPRIQEWDPCAGTGGIWQSEHDFRDKHASQFTTGRFALLPKNLVTGATKSLISQFRSAVQSQAGWFLLRATEAPLSRGFFAARVLTEKRPDPTLLPTGRDLPLTLTQVSAMTADQRGGLRLVRCTALRLWDAKESPERAGAFKVGHIKEV